MFISNPLFKMLTFFVPAIWKDKPDHVVLKVSDLVYHIENSDSSISYHLWAAAYTTRLHFAYPKLSMAPLALRVQYTLNLFVSRSTSSLYDLLILSRMSRLLPLERQYSIGCPNMENCISKSTLALPTHRTKLFNMYVVTCSR